MSRELLIRSCFPKCRLSNEELQRQCPDFSADYASRKLGIASRYTAVEEDCLDLALGACERLREQVPLGDVDLLIFVTQSPVYPLPSMACILHGKLQLDSTVAAIDLNMGCSGYIYGLSVAVSYVKAGLAEKVLLVTSDTYTKYIKEEDYNNRAIFGDGATATLLTSEIATHIGPFVLGTDGRGWEKIIVRADSDYELSFSMDGPGIMRYAMKKVPELVKRLEGKSGVSAEEIDYYVFHQGNEYMLKNIQRILKIPDEKMIINLKECGNTVSSTIPMALEKMLQKDWDGKTVLLCGFGVGLSIGGTILHL